MDRWNGIERLYTEEEVERLRGTIRVEHTIARLGAERLWQLLQDDDYVAALERAHHSHLDERDIPRAVRCAFWIGHNMLFRGETVRAGAWFTRALSLLDRQETDCVERGYLLIPTWLQQMSAGDFEARRRCARQTRRAPRYLEPLRRDARVRRAGSRPRSSGRASRTPAAARRSRVSARSARARRSRRSARERAGMPDAEPADRRCVRRRCPPGPASEHGPEGGWPSS